MKVISAENVQGNFFGGLPYNATWDFGGGNSPSKLTVSVVNERGTYGDPSSSLGYGRTQSVKLGGFSFNGYLVSYSLKETPEAKTLELSYVDKSIDLDRYYVGLKDLWGKNDSKNLILVGKRYHPCDTDLDSTVEYKEIKGIPDPCDPCPEMPPKKYENACDEFLTEFEIFPVYYTFNELIDKLPINCNFNGSDYTDFRGDFVGPLKSVLDSWCSTLGLAYFWDPFDNVLEIVSRSKKISVPSVSRGNNVIDLEIGATVENTFARGTVGYMGRQGEIKDYSCEKSTLENLSCLTLGDLAEDGEYNSGGGGGDGSGGAGGELKDYEAKEIAVALAYYSQAMRNAFIWFYHYGIYGPSEAKSKKSGGGGSGASSGKMPTDKLSFFGNMEILQVYSAEGDEKEKAGFNRINRLLSKDQKDHLNIGTDGKKGSANAGTKDNPNYYFIAARVNQELFEKELSTEERLAQGYLGKYWFSNFKTTIPNTTNYKTEVNIEAPDGNGQWYFKNTQLKNLPIFNFGHEEGSFISELDDELSGSEDEIQSQINKYASSPDEKEVQVNGFILHEREGLWEPNQEFAKWYQKLFDWYADQIPLKFAQDDGRPDQLLSLVPEAKSDGAIKLFVARKGSKSAFKTKIEVVDGNHPAESDRRPIKTETQQSVFGDVEIKELAEYGLGSASKYVKLSIGESDNIIIHCPVGCFAKTTAGTRNQDSSQSESNDNLIGGDQFIQGAENGYDVIATAKAIFSIYLPKLEETYVSPPSTVNVASVTYEYFDQLENNLEPFRKGGTNFNRTNCMPDKAAMLQYMKKLDKFVKYSQEQPTRRVSFRMAGVFPEAYGIYEGLSNVSINITDNGVFTNYVLEDKIIMPPSTEVLTQRLKQNLPPRKSINDNKEPINATNLKRYENAVRQVGS